MGQSWREKKKEDVYKKQMGHKENKQQDNFCKINYNNNLNVLHPGIVRFINKCG